MRYCKGGGGKERKAFFCFYLCLCFLLLLCLRTGESEITNGEVRGKVVAAAATTGTGVDLNRLNHFSIFLRPNQLQRDDD